MKSLARVGFRRQRIFTTFKGVTFQGVLFPTNDQTLQSLTFISQRHLLRTRVNEPVAAGDLFYDEAKRAFLLANNDVRPHAKTFLLFEMNAYVRWDQSTTAVIHPVTKQETAGPPEYKGHIWCAIENLNATMDGGMNVLVDRDRVITGADIRLGDRIDGRLVKEVTKTLGITVAEIE